MTAATLPLTGAELVPIIQGGLNTQTPSSNMIPQVFISSLIAFPGAPGLVISVAHGLSKIPQFVRVVMACQTAERNFTIGQEMDVFNLFNAGTIIMVGNVYCDATKVYFADNTLYTGNEAGVQYVNPTTAGLAGSFGSFSNWRLKAYAFAF